MSTEKNIDDAKIKSSALYEKYGKNNIYIMTRQNKSGIYKIYAYNRDDLYKVRPPQPRKQYKKREATNRPRGAYKKKIALDGILSVLNEVLAGDTDKLDAIVSRL